MNLRCASILGAIAIIAAGCGATRIALPVTARPYTLGIGDRLHLIAPTIPELHEVEIVIKEDGHIHLPLLNDVFAAGRTPTQLGAELTEKLHRYYITPDIQVRVSMFGSQQWFAESSHMRAAQPYTAQDRPVDALTAIQTNRLTRLEVLRPSESEKHVRIDPGGEPLEAGDVVHIQSGLLMLNGKRQ
jgi:hypothetical protein